MRALNDKQIQEFCGRKFGQLLVKSYIGKIDDRHTYICECSCGAIKNIKMGDLNRGNTISCGCRKVNRAKTMGIRKHNKRNTPEYGAWRSMKKRCLLKTHHAYSDYGARGINVCDRWLESFENFFADMGERPSAKHSLERKENNGNYDPRNCIWATRKEQCRNKRNNNTLTLDGKTASIVEWSEITNQPAPRLYKRKEAGWSDSDIINGRII